MIKRVIVIVLDSVGIGALPDAVDFGDEGANTLGHIAQNFPGFKLPQLTCMGLGNISAQTGLTPVDSPSAAYGRAIEVSPGKDTTTGHWEIAGTILKQPFPCFPDGFPAELIRKFENAIGTKTIGNKAASGTVIIEELGAEHLRTGFPIVYTSADSVFQIAMHEGVIPLERQYEICRIARKLLTGKYAVGRVIARPFISENGKFRRTANRRDFSLKPPVGNMLNIVSETGMDVLAVGKIYDIYAGSGITSYSKTKDNMDGVDKTLGYIKSDSYGIIMANLVDFDMLYGHRRDVSGYAKALMDFDTRIPEIVSALKEDDVLIITADHGNDPTYKGTDHTREYIPLLIYGSAIKRGVSIGTRSTFADIGATVTQMLHTAPPENGMGFYDKISVAPQRSGSMER